MLDPRTILIAVPCYDGRLMSETAGALIGSHGLYAAVSFPTECSHVSLARNLIAGAFLASPYEWLVCIDSDIVFQRTDLEILLEPCNTLQSYQEDEEERAQFALGEGVQARPIGGDMNRLTVNLPPRPTRAVVAQCADRAHLDSKTGAAADLLVCAEYSFKNDNLEPCKLGMGFVRIHRQVFQLLDRLTHDYGGLVEVRRDLVDRLRGIHFGDDQTAGYPREDVDALLRSVEDKAGQPRLWQCSYKGRLYHDYFPSGPILSQFVPTAEWKGEDHGFFTLCMLAGIMPRIETRTRLIHMGRKGYPYLGPDVGGGQ